MSFIASPAPRSRPPTPTTRSTHTSAPLSINKSPAHEHDADRIADQITGMPEPSSRRCACGGGCPTCRTGRTTARQNTLQSKADHAGETGQTIAPPIVNDVLATPGKPLDPATRNFMEPRFGHDLGQVRVHTDAHAAKAARAVGAHAFTVGSDVVFGSGRYSPHTADGKSLLAHELAHTFQQQNHHTVQRSGENKQPQTAEELYAAYENDYGALGAELYRLIKESPNNIPLAYDVLAQPSWFYVDDLAYAFTEPLSVDDLGRIGKQKFGAALLKRLKESMEGTVQTDAEDIEIEKINDALDPARRTPEEAAPAPSPAPDSAPDQTPTIVGEVVADLQIDAADWKKLSGLDSSKLESSLETNGIPALDAQMIAFIATQQSPLFEVVHNGYVATLDSTSLALSNEPLTPIVNGAVDDLTLTMEEIRLVREAILTRGENLETGLTNAGFDPSVIRMLVVLFNSSFSLTENDLPSIKLEKGAEGRLTVQGDPRIQLLQTLFKKNVWGAAEKKQAKKVMQIDPRMEPNQVLLQTAGMEPESAKLIVARFFESLPVSVDDLTLLELSFVQQGDKLALTENSKFDLSLQWNYRKISEPEIVEKNLSMKYTEQGTVKGYTFPSGTVEDAKKLQGALGGHLIEIFIAQRLLPRQSELLDPFSRTMRVIPAAHSAMIKKVEFDPNNSPDDSFAAAAAQKSEGKIIVYGGRTPSVNDLLHETGHIVGYTGRENFINTEWKEAIKQDGVGISLYGFKTPDEDFAETYLHYRSGGKDNADSRKRYSHRFSLLEKM
jgi:hypothetical protein